MTGRRRLGHGLAAAMATVVACGFGQTTCGDLVERAVDAYQVAREAAVDVSEEELRLLRGEAGRLLEDYRDQLALITAESNRLACDPDALWEEFVGRVERSPETSTKGERTLNTIVTRRGENPFEAVP